MLVSRPSLEAPNAEYLYQQQMHSLRAKVDHVFIFILGFQLLIAVTLSPLFAGLSSLTFWGAGLITFPALYFAWFQSGRKITRYFVALSQICLSALFIYLSRDRLETHFHIFISVAALAAYADISLLWFAAAVVALDHFWRGHLFPESLYGTTNDVVWMGVRHVVWLTLEVLVLSLGIFSLSRQFRQMSEQREQLEHSREKAFRHSNKKSHFLSSLSHEIRTPLSSVIGFAEILKDTDLDEDQKEYVDTILRCSETLLHLISDVLDLSKIENGSLEIDHHIFNVKELHNDIYKMFILRCSEKGLFFEMKLDEEIPELLKGDSHRLRQVLMNLISNAIKFTEQGCVILEVNRHPTEKMYTWFVRDTGRGIHESKLEKLFEMYFQEEASVSRQYGGTGLGLAISKNLVELMGGKIAVRSKLGEGSEFTFSLKFDEV